MPALQDAYGGPLTFSGGNSDTLMLALLRAAYTGRSDTHLVASMEQALPLQPDWLNFNRFCVRAEGSALIVKGLRARVSGKGALSAALPHNNCSLLVHCSPCRQYQSL
jgi:outer membrane protein insertion porin family